MRHSVVIECERCRKRPSGLQQYCELLVEGVAELRDDCVVYGPYSIAGLPQVQYKGWHKLWVPPFSRYPLVHLTHQASAFNHFQKRGKVLLTVHDLNYLHVEDTSARRRAKFVRQVRRNVELADHIVCISNFTKGDLLAHKELFPSVVNKPISVIYNGLVYPGDNADEQLAEELVGRPYFLNIGQSMPKKNQLSLVRMLPFLVGDLVLVLSSLTNAYTQSLIQEAEQLGVKDRLHLFTKISEAEKQTLLKHATAMLHPSLAEGFGYTPVEQMYYGRPVFLAPRCSLPEIGGEVAYYFDDMESAEAMANSVIQGMEDFQQNEEERGRRLRERAESFSQAQMVKKYSELYDQLVL